MNAAIARLPAKQQRALAIALFVVAAVVALSLLLLPVVLLHVHYDNAIASMTDRLDTYRRVAAQAPEYRRALDVMREKDARRFFLKNTAANLAGAELQEIVRGAVEGNGGRITISQNQAPKDDGRYRQIGLNVQFFATTPNLQKILYALETQQPYLVLENLTLRPLNAFRGFRPAAGQEPEINVQLDVAAFDFAERKRSSHGRRDQRIPDPPCAPHCGGSFHCSSPRRVVAWETNFGRAIRLPPPPEEPVAARPVVTSLLPEYAIAGGTDRAVGYGPAYALQSDAPAGACAARRSRRSRGCSAASSR